MVAESCAGSALQAIHHHIHAPIPLLSSRRSDQPIADKQALEAASLKEDDAAGLLGYLRTRTLSDSDLTKIQAIIK